MRTVESRPTALPMATTQSPTCRVGARVGVGARVRVRVRVRTQSPACRLGPNPNGS